MPQDSRHGSHGVGPPPDSGPLWLPIIECLQDPLHVVGRDMRVVMCNEAFRRLSRELGLYDRPVGMRLFDVFPFLPEAVRQEYREVFETGRPMVTEDVNTVAGRTITCEVHKTLVPDGGRVEHVVTVLRDISARRRAEAELQATLERLRGLQSIINRSPAMVLLRRAADDWPVEYCSENVAQLGYAAEDFLSGRVGWSDITHPEDRGRLVAELERCRSRGVTAFNRQYRLIDGANRVRWVDDWTQVVLDEKGNVTHYQGIILDITDRRQTERALRESEEKYRLLAENASDIVYATDAEGIMTYVGPQVRQYGFEPGELASRSCLDLVVPEDRERVASDLGRTLETGAEFPTEFRIEDRDGRTHWLEERGKVRRDASGRIVGITGVLRDITERKRAEKALHEVHAKLAQAREEERRRLARELHDSLGQGLIAVHLQLESARREAGACECAASSGSLTRLSKECNNLIREVRQISRGLYPAALEQLGLAPALRRLLETCEPAGIAGALRCREDVESLRFAEDVEIALFRIAQEAVSNAVRHAHCRRIQIELACTDGQVRLSIADDGKGFDYDEAFGRGMGLVTMRERAEAVGGGVSVTSRPGLTCIEVSVDGEKE